MLKREIKRQLSDKRLCLENDNNLNQTLSKLLDQYLIKYVTANRILYTMKYSINVLFSKQHFCQIIFYKVQLDVVILYHISI